MESGKIPSFPVLCQEKVYTCREEQRKGLQKGEYGFRKAQL